MFGESMEEVKQVVGVLTGGVEADDEVNVAADGAPGDVLEPLAELGVACGGLGELQLGGGRLEIVAEKSGVVAIARGVDADADADDVDGGRLRSGRGSW